MFTLINHFMKTKNNLLIGSVFFILLGIASCIPLTQTPRTVVLQNKDGSTHIKAKNGQLSAGSISEDENSALWELKPVTAPYFTLRNLSVSDKYLHTKNGSLEYSTIPATDLAAHWKETKVTGTKYSRIENRQNPQLALYVQGGSLTAINSDVNDGNAHWAISNPSKVKEPNESETPNVDPIVNPFPEPKLNSNSFRTNIFSNTDILNLNGMVSFFYINEFTNNEYVSVGDGGNIVRWADENKDLDKWCIYPTKNSKGEKRYRIQTLFDKKYMSVGSNGNIISYDYKNDDTQLFDFKKLGDGNYNIIESTNDEYVAVGWGGNILRWKLSNDKDQKFALTPYQPKTKPTLPKISAGKTVYVNNRIPYPKFNEGNIEGGLTRGESYIISEDLIPATLVDDSQYSSKIDQIKSSPYYYLVRRQYYMPNPIFIPPGGKSTYTAEMDYSFSSSSVNQIEQKVSWGIEASVGVEYEGATASLKTQYENSKSYLNRSENNTSQKNKITRTVELASPATRDFIVVVWQLMNEYTLYDFNGNAVDGSKWESEETKYQVSYPTLPFQLKEDKRLFCTAIFFINKTCNQEATSPLLLLRKYK